MRKVIRRAVQKATNLPEVRDKLLAVLAQQNGSRIGYVAGIITSDGPEHIEKNLQKLEKCTQRIKQRESIVVFSAVDVFDEELFIRLKASTLPQDSWWIFWREVLGSGHITDIYMTPRWQESTGARDEHETATKVGIAIHYEKD